MLKKFFAFAVVVSLAASAFALADELPQVSVDQFMVSFWQFIGDIKGASTLAVVAGVVQILVKFFNTSLSSFAGKYRLLVIAILTVVGSVVGLVSQGVSWQAALMNGATLTAFQVLGHQVWKQFVEKALEQPKA